MGLANWGGGRLDSRMCGHRGEAVELTAILWAAPEGGFSALNPETGTTSEGETQAEALSNLAEATALYIEEFPLPLGARPVVTTFHITDVA
jgi:predicted RNase H-like HicB family nuclease